MLPTGKATMVEKVELALTILAATLVLGAPTRALGAAQEPTATGKAQSQESTSATEEGSRPPAADNESAFAELPPSNEMKTLDALAVRPVTFVSSVFSAGTFVLALPFAALDPALGVEKTRKNLVDYPFSDTFKRPLGDFDGSAW
jgi:hypothetical protein